MTSSPSSPPNPTLQRKLQLRAEWAHSLFQQTVVENRWIAGDRWEDSGFPHPKQQQFLFNAETRELFFGGAGGGGKVRPRGTVHFSS